MRSKNKVLLVKLFFLRKGLLQRSLRKQGLKFCYPHLTLFLYCVAKESKKTRIETVDHSVSSSSDGIDRLQKGLRKQGLKHQTF